MTELVWCIAVSLMLVLPVHGQQPATGDAGWNARMAALDAERDAQIGVAVSIVFDDSGSMNDNRKLVMAKQAFRAWLERAPETDRFGLTAINAGPLVKLQPNDKSQVLAAVDRLRARGDTPLADTIAAVGQDIRARRSGGTPYERQVMVILTDGEDTTKRGIRGVQQEITRLRADGVEVIAFGYQGEGDYMRGSATHFFSPESEEDIAKGLSVIGSEIGDTSDVVVDAPTRAAMARVAPPVAGQPLPVAAPTATPPPREFSPYAPPVATPSLSIPPATHTYKITGPQVVIFIVIFIALRSFRRRRR